MEELIKNIVDYLIDTGTSLTTSGNYIISYDEVAAKFNIQETWIHNNRDRIIEELDSREEILSETWGEENDEFDMNFCLAYCKEDV